jgi:hypothetical protein
VVEVKNGFTYADEFSELGADRLGEGGFGLVANGLPPAEELGSECESGGFGIAANGFGIEAETVGCVANGFGAEFGTCCGWRYVGLEL